MANLEQGKVLLALARAAIAERFGETAPSVPHASWLQEQGATFVTLTLHGRLRGCIGTLEAHRPLLDDVRNNAVAAAFRDPRFASLSAQEFAEISIEVSLLSKSEAMPYTGEQDALAQLRPGVDGVILEYGHHRATFLPQVWEQLPEPVIFMAHLKNKAGLNADFWSDEIRLARYSVEKWHEGERHG